MKVACCFFSLLFVVLKTEAWNEDIIIENAVLSSSIETAQVYPSGNPMGYPFLMAGMNGKFDFHFDEMTTDRETYRFAAIHCDHDWRISDLDPMEYIQGFSLQEIGNVEPSFNTITDYIHYQFSFPNDMMKPKLSGNYGIIVFSGMDPEDTDSWLLTFRVMIYEDLVGVVANFSSSSIISRRYNSQEIDFSIIPGNNYVINDASNDLYVTILQNGNWQYAIQGLKPIFYKPSELTYNYSNGENLFFGGSEYRGFEIKDLRFNSYNVEGIYQQEGEWHVYLRPDKPLGGKAYRSDIDINGKYFIRNDRASDSNLEAEYVWVHFVLPMPPISEARVIIEGGFSNGSAENFVCSYDEKLRAYTAVVRLKQGLYNYRYVVEDEYHPGGDLSLLEGNYSQTENDYHILVYHYDRMKGTDRLIAVKAMNSVK
ncbi:MAG: DUF5103 domain-containing protein [Crocinitomicaceae bacterium]|nr:DUF5103 domain-containing protein [Crocinitomicaceae bacterium]